MSRYKINIMEHQYYINTDRDPAWVKMLQERLNGQIDEIREGCPNLSAFDTFALLTMNLMDQLAKSEEAAANLRQQLTNYLRESSAVRAPGDDYRRAGRALEAVCRYVSPGGRKAQRTARRDFARG